MTPIVEIHSGPVRLVAEEACECGAELIEADELREAPAGVEIECPCGSVYMLTMTHAGYSDRGGGEMEAVCWPAWAAKGRAS